MFEVTTFSVQKTYRCWLNQVFAKYFLHMMLWALQEFLRKIHKKLLLLYALHESN